MIGRVPGGGHRLERAEAHVFAEQDVDRAAAARERRRVAFEQRLDRFGVVVVIVGERHPAQPAAVVDRGGQAWRCSSSSGPGSITHAGRRPTTHVFVPESVSGPGFSARTRRMS